MNYKRYLFASLVFVFTAQLYAQKINQYDANGKRTGIWKKFYENKRIRYQGQFKNGKEYGTFKFYDISTSDFPVIIKEYNEHSEKVSVRFFTLKGKLRAEGKMIGKSRVGAWSYFYPDTGKIFSEENYQNGKIHGTVKNYYPNGVLTQTVVYTNGLKNGISKKYTDESVLIEAVMYQNNKRNGEAKFYDLKGNLKEKGIFKDNKRFGEWEYYLNGERVQKKKTKEVYKVKKAVK